MAHPHDPSTSPAFERTSKRRRGYPSETNVKRGLRFVHGEDAWARELVEQLGRNDPCPCGSGTRFQAVLPSLRLLSTAPNAMTIGGSDWWGRRQSVKPFKVRSRPIPAV